MKHLLLIGLLQVSVAGVSFAANECADFSGFWEGRCEDSLKNKDKSFLALEQLDCRAIHWGPHPIVIGTETRTEWSGGNSRRSETINWLNSQKTILSGPVTVRHLPSGQSLDAVVTVHKPEDKKLSLYFEGTVEQQGNTLPYRQECSYKLVKKIKGD